MPEAAPGAGAVHLGRLQHLPGHGQQPGQHRDRHEREPVVDDVEGGDAVEGQAVGEPVGGVGVDQPDAGEQPHHDAVAGVEDVDPHVGAAHGRHRPGHHDRGRQDAAPPRAQAQQQHRHQRADDHGQDDAHHREHRGVGQGGLPQQRVGEDLAEVVEAAPVEPALAQLAQAEVLEGQADHPDQRVDQQGPQHQQGRRLEQPRQPARGQPTTPASPRRGRGGRRPFLLAQVGLLRGGHRFSCLA